MAQYPAMPLWTDAYLGDTTHLSTIEHGAYLLLLMAMWRNDGSLPNDDRLLAKYTRLTAGQWARVKPILAPFFTIKDGKIAQGRLTDELNAVRRRSRSASDSIKSRWLKEKEKPHTNEERPNNERNTTIPISISKEEEEGARAREHAHAREASPDLFLGVLAACGLKSGNLPTYWMPPTAEVHVNRWLNLGISPDEVLTVVRETQKNHRDPPKGPRAFDGAMQRYAAEKVTPPMNAPPLPKGARHERNAFDRTIAAVAEGLSDGSIELDTESRNPFASRPGRDAASG